MLVGFRVFGSKTCRVRGSRIFCDLDDAVLREPQYPQHVGAAMWRLLPAPRRTAVSRPADASTLTSSTALPILVFLLMSTPKSLSIETAASPADVPFIPRRNILTVLNSGR